MENGYVQFGCGISALEGWRNFDAGPAFWLQKHLPFTKSILIRKGFPDYPVERIEYGDIITGSAVPVNSVKAVYCSHVLEHLTLSEFRRAVRSVFTCLEPGGRFRIVVPDLDFYVSRYVSDPSPERAFRFLNESGLGHPRGRGLLAKVFGRSVHLWMWNYEAMAKELEDAGFVEIRRAFFNDSEEPRFKELEEPGRWEDCLGVECRRP
jgi:SAM-dependent methyltransferase